MLRYDLIVIGSGSAGFTAAATAYEHGLKKVLLVEKRKLGYSLCSDEGCMPSKTLIVSADIKEVIENSDKFGIKVNKPKVNWEIIQKRVRSLVKDRFSATRQKAIINSGIEVVKGSASFIGSHRIRVADELYTASNIIIATGSVVNIPPIRGLSQAGYIDSSKALFLERLPDSLLIVGGGYIAVEVGYLFHKMGVEVTILELEERILPKLDVHLSLSLQEIMRRDGIDIVTEAKVQEVKKKSENKVAIAQLKSGEEKSLCAEEIMVATGRRPAVEGLNLEKAGVHLTRQDVIQVNEYLQTSVPHIYAVGDVNGKLPLVHTATMEGRIAGLNVVGPDRQKMNYDLVTQVIFSSPEIGSVGLTEKQAKERGLKVVTAKTSMDDMGKAIVMGQTKGFIKMIAESPSGRILGLHMLGPQATDVIQVVLPHIYHQDTVFDILNIPYPHPTLGEALSYSAEDIADKL